MTLSTPTAAGKERRIAYAHSFTSLPMTNNSLLTSLGLVLLGLGFLFWMGWRRRQARQPHPGPATSFPEVAAEPDPRPAASPTPTPLDPELRRLLEQPRFHVDPVFPRDRYLFAFACSVLAELLRAAGKPEAIPSMREAFSQSGTVCVRAGQFVAWVFDFETADARGRTGREEFLRRASGPKAPEPATDGITVREHLVGRGVSKIQLGQPDNGGVPAPVQICQLRTVGWYVAGLVPPKLSPSDRAAWN